MIWDPPPIEHHCVQPLKPWMQDFQRHLPALPSDPLSNAEPSKAVTTHLVWDVAVDFPKKELIAQATYAYQNKVTGNGELILDVDHLEIEEVLVNGSKVSFTIVPSKIESKPDGLVIPIPPKEAAGSVAIRYRTKDSATGIFWVDPQFTEGGEHPLVYTLFQPTAGASAIPGQHSPQVRLTYELNVKTGNPALLALSSVSNNPTCCTPTGEYRNLKMTRAIPLYLLSLHVGSFDFHSFDYRTGIYAEPEAMKIASRSFEKLPEYMQAAEELCGPYRWGTYTPIQLGWAFPYGAMEHPCASTFGSICNEEPFVIPHELAHSWTGNDITNCNWQQFFWNEGATTFLEYQISEKIWDTDFASMIFLSLIKEAKESMEQFEKRNPELLKLCVDGTSYAFTTIPYAKGALFFFMLQEAMGRDVFWRFFKDYMTVFFQNTMSEERFLTFLATWLEKEQGMDDFGSFVQKHQIGEWLHGTKLPSNVPQFHSKLVDAIEEEIAKLTHGKMVDQKKIRGWEVTTQGSFLSLLSGKATKEQVAALDAEMDYTHAASMVLKGEWIVVCAQAGYLPPQVQDLIISHLIKRNSAYGAARVCTLLKKTETGRLVIQRLLAEERGRLFPLTRNAIQKVLTTPQPKD